MQQIIRIHALSFGCLCSVGAVRRFRATGSTLQFDSRAILREGVGQIPRPREQVFLAGTGVKAGGERVLAQILQFHGVFRHTDGVDKVENRVFKVVFPIFKVVREVCSLADASRWFVRAVELNADGAHKQADEVELLVRLVRKLAHVGELFAGNSNIHADCRNMLADATDKSVRVVHWFANAGDKVAIVGEAE